MTTLGEPVHDRVTWADLLSGDVILGPVDGLAWLVWRQGRRFGLSRPAVGAVPAQTQGPGTPKLSGSVVRIRRGETTHLITGVIVPVFGPVTVLDESVSRETWRST